MIRNSFFKWAVAAALGLAVPAFAVTAVKHHKTIKSTTPAAKSSLAPSTATPKPAAVRLGRSKSKATSAVKHTTTKSVKHVGKTHRTGKIAKTPIHKTTKTSIHKTSKTAPKGTTGHSTVLTKGHIPLKTIK